MKKRLALNPILRFKLGRKIQVPKFLTPWKTLTLQSVDLRLLALEDFSRKAVNTAKETVRPIVQSTQKAVKRNKDIAALQLLLWNSGAFEGVIDKRTGKQVTYDRAVDGLMGRMTNEAKLNSLKRREAIPITEKKEVTYPSLKSVSNRPRIVTTSGAFVPSLVLELSYLSVTPHVEEAADFVGHNPANMFIEDVDRSLSNRLTNKLFGKRIFSGRTITSLPSLQTQELINLVLFARSLGKNNFLADEMYPKMYGYNYASSKGINGEDRSGYYERMNTPRERLEHTLGSFRFYNDNNGNTIVEDYYDFNNNQGQKGETRYADLRNWAGEYATKSSDPNRNKIRYRINLGKI